VVFALGRAYEYHKALRARQRVREANRITPAYWLRQERLQYSAEVDDGYLGRHRIGDVLGTSKQYVSWVMDTGSFPFVEPPTNWTDRLVAIDV
jgi:hypothetical protein